MTTPQAFRLAGVLTDLSQPARLLDGDFALCSIIFAKLAITGPPKLSSRQTTSAQNRWNDVTDSADK
jgi:hypothetical protein